MMNETRKCTKCKRIKIVAEFLPGTPTCKECHNEYMRAWKKTPKGRASTRKYGTSESHRAASRRRYANNPAARLQGLASRTLRRHKISKKSHERELLEMSKTDAIAYLERNGRKLADSEIDHIIPMSLAKLWHDPIQAGEALSSIYNMQLLDRKTNNAKKDKIPHPDVVPLEVPLIAKALHAEAYYKGFPVW